MGLHMQAEEDMTVCGCRSLLSHCGVTQSVVDCLSYSGEEKILCRTRRTSSEADQWEGKFLQLEPSLQT